MHIRDHAMRVNFHLWVGSLSPTPLVHVSKIPNPETIGSTRKITRHGLASSLFTNLLDHVSCAMDMSKLYKSFDTLVKIAMAAQSQHRYVFQASERRRLPSDDSRQQQQGRHSPMLSCTAPDESRSSMMIWRPR